MVEFQTCFMGSLSLGALSEICLGGSMVYWEMDMGLGRPLLVDEHVILRYYTRVLGMSDS